MKIRIFIDETEDGRQRWRLASTPYTTFSVFCFLSHPNYIFKLNFSYNFNNIMNKEKFYAAIRTGLFAGSISTRQFEGIDAILTALSANGITDTRHMAYMLATAYHETAKTMQPIEEYGKGQGRDYGKKLKMGKGPGKRVEYLTPDKLYYGRGHVQLTWYENYQAMGKLLGLPLLEQPELMLTPGVSAKVMIEGMTRGKSKFGDFTGKSLEDYFNDKITDPVNARKIINGVDKAETIAGYYKIFYDAIML